MKWSPAVSMGIVNVACPLASTGTSSAIELPAERKSTVPPVTRRPRLVIVAVKVSSCPGADGRGDEVNSTVAGVPAPPVSTDCQYVTLATGTPQLVHVP